MNILVVMIPLSIVLLIGAGLAFFWAVEHQQFDDLETPRLLPLLDDPAAPVGDPGNADDARDLHEAPPAPR
ncbi:MAG TPA: cbb3-type cytochrome oxidase assembly protein CcoS [Rubrivivax sp.]|nr:cbb3-type cytochrome oxidase assembly protein CcoS [Burkholderiales bacterium]HNT39548.1 cbb3-type cytochrome oxidase assembly protein CcoS [Rubrivivax sp.]